MAHAAPSRDQALSFYRAALTTARQLDQDSDARVLDADADAAWHAYGGELPPVVRFDLVLRNFAMLYPAAFAPGPIFGLSGWYDDAPWGTGFERPERDLLENLFVGPRNAPGTAREALEMALRAWGLGADTLAAEDALLARLSSSTTIIVAGARAAAAIARVSLRGERLSVRTHVVLVSADPAARHALGIACALLREAGLPLLANLKTGDAETLDAWASREKRRLGLTRADLAVTSADASPAEKQALQALAAALDVADSFSVAAPS